jgi:hypothetical protein
MAICNLKINMQIVHWGTDHAKNWDWSGDSVRKADVERGSKVYLDLALQTKACM